MGKRHFSPLRGGIGFGVLSKCLNKRARLFIQKHFDEKMVLPRLSLRAHLSLGLRVSPHHVVPVRNRVVGHWRGSSVNTCRVISGFLQSPGKENNDSKMCKDDRKQLLDLLCGRRQPVLILN